MRGGWRWGVGKGTSRSKFFSGVTRKRPRRSQSSANKMAFLGAGPRGRPRRNGPDSGAISPAARAGPRMRPRRNWPDLTTKSPDCQAGPRKRPRRSRPDSPPNRVKGWRVRDGRGAGVGEGGAPRGASSSRELPANDRAEIKYRQTKWRFWRRALADGRSRTHQIPTQYGQMHNRAPKAAAQK